MLHACAERFDVTENLENFLVFGRTKQDLSNKACNHEKTTLLYSLCFKFLFTLALTLFEVKLVFFFKKKGEYIKISQLLH